MNILSLSFISLSIIILIITIIVIKIRLEKKVSAFTGIIQESFRDLDSKSAQRTNELAETYENTLRDIPSDISKRFDGIFISSSIGNEYTSIFSPYYFEAITLSNQLKYIYKTPPEVIQNFINDYESIPDLIKSHNDKVIRGSLEAHKVFFDKCLLYPLDNQQRRSIVSEEDNCLVVSSAGSGKTSSIIGKIKYLTQIKNIDPKKILIISYTNKAALELTERLSTPNLIGYTFHKLALNIISQSTKIKPSICDNTDAIIVGVFNELSTNDRFKKNVLEYFIDYQESADELEKQEEEKREFISGQKKRQIKALLPDMDGKPIYVRSQQEQKICLALSSLGIKFRYEEPYEFPLADEMHSQYRPDFSIYYEKDGKVKRIYLEHFGIDEHGFVPSWFAKDKNITYEEANKKYNDGITWKIEAHKKFGTELLTTSSADFHYTDIQKKLKILLNEANVPTAEISDSELYSIVVPKDSKIEKVFIRLIITFINLYKSSCKPISSVIQEAKRANDERSVFFLENILKPILEQYTNTLCIRKQIDFTDAILQATEICKTSHPIEYEYIIVDEFQDISLDRYYFLKQLRHGNPPAKLYCVGDDWQSIYRFSGSDMSLFNKFSEYFGPTEINKIETTYRFGEPLVSLSSKFIKRNKSQIQKEIHPFRYDLKTNLEFHPYDRFNYCNVISTIIASIPTEKTIFLLGRYSFDDYYLSFNFQSFKEGNRFYYLINDRKIEFITAHKSKGLEADYVIILQCNKDTYGFPSLMTDNPVLNYVLTKGDQFPFGEERRLFYVAITRAKEKTYVLYDRRFPSVFVDEFLNPESISEESYLKHRNANKRWTYQADQFLLKLHKEGKSIKYISDKMGRSQTAIAMRLNKLKLEDKS